MPHVSTDLAGPRISWTTVSDDNTQEAVELYAGEWSITRDVMGDDCCWHEEPRRILTTGEAMDLLTPGEVATWQWKYAAGLGGQQGGAMKRSLRAALKRRGLRLVN